MSSKDFERCSDSSITREGIISHPIGMTKIKRLIILRARKDVK